MKVKRSDIELVAGKWSMMDKQYKKCVSCGSMNISNIKDAWASDPIFAWLYVHCYRCGYDSALWKVFQRANFEMQRGRSFNKGRLELKEDGII